MKVALFGKMRSGKDTVGKILIDEYHFKRFAFGDGIGEIIEKYFPEALAGGKPRKHYQHIGQELRVLNPDVWVNYLISNIKEFELVCKVFNMPEKVVITDGRQFNEAEKLREEGFLIIKVTTPEELRFKRMKELGDVFSPEQLNHETELQVDMIQADIEIINDGSLDDLRSKVQKIVTEYKGEI